LRGSSGESPDVYLCPIAGENTADAAVRRSSVTRPYNPCVMRSVWPCQAATTSAAMPAARIREMLEWRSSFGFTAKVSGLEVAKLTCAGEPLVGDRRGFVPLRGDRSPNAHAVQYRSRWACLATFAISA
jgi:hypothetical protein